MCRHVNEEPGSLSEASPVLSDLLHKSSVHRLWPEPPQIEVEIPHLNFATLGDKLYTSATAYDTV